MDVEEIIEQLKGIRCHSTLRQRATNKDIKVLSCPDAIGKALERVMNTYVEIENGFTNEMIYEIEEENKKDRINIKNEDIMESNKGNCPECGSKVDHEGGCMICRNCGFSKCG